MSFDVSAFAEELGIDVEAMDTDGIGFIDDSPADEYPASLADQSSFDKQKLALQTYVDSLPYKCESVEEMQTKLEHIIGKLLVCAEAKNWPALTEWDAMLQCWLSMRYPMTTSVRAKLVRFYFELCILPGIQARVIRSWADMVSHLLADKAGHRKLETKDLQLPWKPLWRTLRKELFPKKRLIDPSRNMNNILLYVAESCSRYFPAEEIEEMLSTFLPLLTPDTTLTMIPVLTSFLPLTHTHLYIPVLFKSWEAINSFGVDDWLLKIAGDLSEEHVAGQSGSAGKDGGAIWKDVGMWTTEEWNMLINKGLDSLCIPVGKSKGASSTAMHADARQNSRVKKPISRINALAKIFVYSMAGDGPIRSDSPATSSNSQSQQSGYLAGSKALDSLDKLMTSTESFFHPSNSGHWTMLLTGLLQRLTSEFSDRWFDEAQPKCKTPVAHRLTPAIRRSFVVTLRTPALLAMFSKDPFSITMAQRSLRIMAALEPNLVMPELLERAYGGLEVVNETHRTTAVLKMLSGISHPLVSERLWLGGQKHLLPLLELCLPGIDLNDPNKTVCATMFIVSSIQHVKIGDLSMHHSGFALSGDAPGEGLMEIDQEETWLPEGSEASPFIPASKEEERTLARESTATFADWVTSLFRRILALYENLPEEGGKKNTTGGKQEESVLKSIKGMLDILCLHLSDQLFDLVLTLVYDYATTNAKSNAVRAFGQLIACLSRTRPQQTIDKFLPFCIAQITEELKHGASSIRTTSTHDSVPSDTTLHWNISILRGCLGYGGPALLKHKEAIIGLFELLVESTKNERGYSGAGHLISRVLHTLATVYPLNSRFVNNDEWKDPNFDKAHILQWGRTYEAKDVKIEWHVATPEEIDFVLEILDRVASPTLDKVDTLLADPGSWSNIARNDFCRFLNVLRAVWSGLPTIYKEGPKQVVNPCVDPNFNLEGLFVDPLDVQAGFTLTDPKDPRYQKVVNHRTRYGEIVHKAATVLRQTYEGEDHIDAVITVVKAIDTFLLDYGMSRSEFSNLQKNLINAREVNRISTRQRDNSRVIWVKRAQIYHSGRLYMHALYRRRSELDDKLLRDDLAELCLSPYTRVRRQAQAVLSNACGYYIRSTKFVLPTMFNALSKGSDPDRIKGALYFLGNKGTAAYVMDDPVFQGQFLISLLECQHEEKPSVQKLVNAYSRQCLTHLSEEVLRTAAYADETLGVQVATHHFSTEPFTVLSNKDLTLNAQKQAPKRIEKRLHNHDSTISAILELAVRPTTHWRYVQMATEFLSRMIRRDAPTPPEIARFFMEHTVSPQPTIRVSAQRALEKMLTFVKIRTYAKNNDELWFCEWSNPLSKQLPIVDPTEFLGQFKTTSGPMKNVYVDKLTTGFLTWTPSIKCYSPVTQESPPIVWEQDSQPSLKAISDMMTGEYYSQLALLWSQESNKSSTTANIRGENASYIKSLAKTFDGDRLQGLIDTIEPLLFDSDKFKQAAAAEMVAGLLRGSKHWDKSSRNTLWSWLTPHLDRIFAQAKPDTILYWCSVVKVVVADHDHRRHQPLVDWILGLQLDFQGDSAFAMTKTLNVVVELIDAMGMRFYPMSEKYLSILFNNANTSYAEIRTGIATALCMISDHQWWPSYPTTASLILACSEKSSPLYRSQPSINNHVDNIIQALPKWKDERLAPPRVSQSQYDKVGMTMLLWLWVSFHGPEASLVLPHAVAFLPEMLKMSELNDNAELQKYSSAILNALSTLYLRQEYVDEILSSLIASIKYSKSWRIRMHALPVLVVFFYRNLMAMSPSAVSNVMDVLLECLSDENVEVREMSSKTLSGVVRCSQRQSIIPLKKRFVSMVNRVKLPPRNQPNYAESLRSMHGAILGICALIESLPYSVEPWMPSLTEVLARHATDPPPISTTIRHCASEFKKTHQDTWHKDQLAFDEDQLQSLSAMLVGTSYYA
ncbi:armadillo-type protein [Hygrophoropsis aurantiaca]|uniref:Armadillo-type protein n=1 Tax=Hygrophoropsis aurantiaca TaxID=72124 RepID=A0ACB8ANJ5_9AGAM|nr:armadillo-type protein [Hygrophoropsis aurantiaca]